MAVDKSFVVKNGLEVNSDLIVADASSKKVGIASTGPRSTLDVRGGIAATDINISGIATIANLQVADGDVDLTNLKVTGFSTLGGLSVDQLTVTGFTTFTDLSYDEISGRNLNLTGIATIPQLDGITVFTDLNGTNATVGVATVTTANVTTLAGYPNFSGGVTVSGAVTATSYSGDGSQLTGLGVGVRTTGSIVGYGFTMLNFVGSGNTFAINGTTVDISIAGGGGGGTASIGIGSTVGDAFSGIVTAGNLWYNTDLGRLFIYYQDEDSVQWVDAAPFNVGIITQLTSVAFSTASVAAPSLSFGNDANTGFFAPADGSVSFGSNGAGIVTFNSTGVLATAYFGDGSNLTGIDATSLKDSGGNVKAQANPAGVVVTGVLTATSFSGDGSGLTGVASTDNIQTATEAEFLGGVKISGVTTTSGLVDMNAGGTANSFKIEDLTSGRVVLAGTGGEVEDSGNLTFDGSTLAVTGSQTVSSNLTVTGNVSLGGTLTYQDVTNIDSIGIITAQQGVQVLANGLDITGFSTFKTGVTVTGFATATGYKVGAAISITDGAVSATRFHGDGSALTGISVGLSTDTASPNNTIVFLDLSSAQDHKLIASGITTISCTGGTEGESHTVRITNSGITTIGFSTAFLFPSGATPSMPTADGALSLISFTINKTGAAGTELFAGASVNFS